ncbi:hypothetical protein K501DRAFT_161556, partial [Backusella circina FSU 941]
QAQQQQPQANLALIENDFEKKIDFFNKIMYACKQKCISNDYLTSDLTQGEALCIDRCLLKFHEADKKIEERIKE